MSENLSFATAALWVASALLVVVDFVRADTSARWLAFAAAFAFASLVIAAFNVQRARRGSAGVVAEVVGLLSGVAVAYAIVTVDSAGWAQWALTGAALAQLLLALAHLLDARRPAVV